MAGATCHMREPSVCRWTTEAKGTLVAINAESCDGGREIIPNAFVLAAAEFKYADGIPAWCVQP